MAAVVATLYWFVESLIHKHLFEELPFELISSDIKELQMRVAMVTTFVCFGLYADRTTELFRAKEEEERDEMVRLGQEAAGRVRDETQALGEQYRGIQEGVLAAGRKRDAAEEERDAAYGEADAAEEERDAAVKARDAA